MKTENDTNHLIEIFNNNKYINLEKFIKCIDLSVSLLFSELQKFLCKSFYILQISPDEPVSPLICEECNCFIEKFNKFVETVIETNKILNDNYIRTEKDSELVEDQKIEKSNKLVYFNRVTFDLLSLPITIPLRDSSGLTFLTIHEGSKKPQSDDGNDNNKFDDILPEQFYETTINFKRPLSSPNNGPILYLPNGKKVKLSDDLVRDTICREIGVDKILIIIYFLF